MKHYKPTGKFFDDVEILCGMYNVKVHPALKQPSLRHGHDDANALSVNQSNEGGIHADKDHGTLTFYKHRVDKNSMKVLFKCLESTS
jgi:hypothetical protein